jgi:hypothetical protein
MDREQLLPDMRVFDEPEDHTENYGISHTRSITMLLSIELENLFACRNFEMSVEPLAWRPSSH